MILRYEPVAPPIDPYVPKTGFLPLFAAFRSPHTRGIASLVYEKSNNTHTLAKRQLDE